MESIYRKARGKINLSLEILGKREDGYHNIKSVFQKINLYDELFIQKIGTNQLEIETNIKELNNNENIIYKAYITLKESYKSITGVKVKLNKKIPMQAGLAGGSTDCASFILGINKLFDLKLSKTQLENIGRSLGADVVPCFYNKAVKAEGIGEIVTPIDTNLKYYIVIIKPEISCSTKEMYQKIEQRSDIVQQNSTERITHALEQNQIDLVASNLYNVFETVIPQKDIIQNIKKQLIKQGAIRKFNDRIWFLCIWYFSRQAESKICLSYVKKTI